MTAFRDGNQLYDEFHDRNPLFVGVLNGCFRLWRIWCGPTSKSEVEFIGLSSHQNATKSSGVVQITRDLQRDIPGRHIIGWRIFWPGNTPVLLKDYMLAKGANSITIVTLLTSPPAGKSPFYPDLAGFEVPDEVVVGFGLTTASSARNMPASACWKPEVLVASGVGRRIGGQRPPTVGRRKTCGGT